jgi:glycogen(starch) synthase
VVAPTHAVAADLCRHYRLRREPQVVPNGSSFAPQPTEKEPFVLGAGRFWDEAKNLAALERARAACPWPILTAGEGSALGRLQPRAVHRLLARASVFASPVRYEPFGLAIVEAARSGCALVLGDIPSLREVWGDAALFTPPDDDDSLAAALRLVIRDSELRQELSERARRRSTRYTVERMADGYSSIYERVRAPVPA